MRFTPRGVGVLVAAAALFGVGHWAGYPLLLALAGAAVGAVAAGVLAAGRRPRVAVVRQLYPTDRIERGRPAAAQLRVHNPGTRRQPGFHAGDRVGAGLHAVAVRPLAPGATAVYHYELPTGVRGRHQVGPLTLSRMDGLGLVRSRLSTGDTATLWVRPRTHNVRPPAGGHPRHHHEGRATDRSLRGSLDVREVREYVAGDEVRHLHWKATARAGQLMVRDYADPKQPRFTTLLDTRLAESVFEEAVEIAASLLVSAARADHPCRLVTPCGVDVGTAGGVSAARRLLDELCVLNQAEDRGVPLVPETLSPGGSLVAVVSEGTSAADRAALASLRPHYSTLMVIVFGVGREAPRVPGVTVLVAANAAEAALKWNAAVAR
ncbi:DUF58 domain-containing protein [Allorhizocola rhizosphaerae]|uniref:DUF58 domain-containing protein n=1 Tax=Allorhizocola rhizosphaerae TaxID=1872709 RepID=UPI000E3C712D|nr:DUF58 domain-containing protein [Allorhizocola rhizosphaerae]